MIRLLLATAAIALLAAAPSIAARPIDAPDVRIGVFTFEFYAADGFDAHPITAQQYLQLVETHQCGPHSAVSRYPAQRLIQAVCEIGE